MVFKVFKIVYIDLAVFDDAPVTEELFQSCLMIFIHGIAAAAVGIGKIHIGCDPKLCIQVGDVVHIVGTVEIVVVDRLGVGK